MRKITGYVLLCLSVIASTTLYSCQKKSVEPTATTTYPFEGYWYGSDLDPNTGIIAQEGILFGPGGTLRVYDFDDDPTSQTDTTYARKADGTYTVVNATSVSVTYTFNQTQETYTGTATFSDKFTQLNLVYESGGTGNDKLATLTKQ